MNAQVLNFSGEKLTKNVEFLFHGQKFKISSAFFIRIRRIENSRILLFTKQQNNLLKNNSSLECIG